VPISHRASVEIYLVTYGTDLIHINWFVFSSVSIDILFACLFLVK